MVEKKADILIECSWEVCNKVGGIYTVVSSKAAQVVSSYKSHYFLVGPYFPHQIPGRFQEAIVPQNLRGVFERLKKKGVMCYYGKWLVEGEPNTILIDVGSLRFLTNEVKKNLWDWYQIDSLNAPPDYNDPLVWSYATGLLIEEFKKEVSEISVAAHFHEWLSGAGLLYLRHHNVPVGTIFTTHATVLGRSIANTEGNLYEVLSHVSADKKAYDHHVEAKHQVEKAAAHAVHVFTTVSEITGIEAEHLLGKKPDLLVPNGLDIGKFPVFEEILLRHSQLRDHTREFILSYFFPYYTFDIKKTLFFFLAGRYEVHAKGIDIYIRALGKLNERLKEEKSDRTIVSFVWVPTGVQNIKPELLESITYFKDVKDTLRESWESVRKNIMYALAGNHNLNREALFEKNVGVLKQKLARFEKKGNPPLCTHDLCNEGDDILSLIQEVGLTNSEEDKVKIIYYPIYLTGADGLLDLNYLESLQGCHLGIFPSYYEPWGYTPLESGALGVPSVTTDLSGFGRYFCNNCEQPEYPGIVVLHRFGKTDDDVTHQLLEMMYTFCNLTREERTKNKLEARKVASTVDWKHFVDNYISAQSMAINKLG